MRISWRLILNQPLLFAAELLPGCWDVRQKFCPLLLCLRGTPGKFLFSHIIQLLVVYAEQVLPSFFLTWTTDEVHVPDDDSITPHLFISSASSLTSLRFASGILLGACFIGLASLVSISCLTMSLLPCLLLFVAKAQAYFFTLFLSGAAKPATHFSTFAPNSFWSLADILGGLGDCSLFITASTGSHWPTLVFTDDFFVAW